MFQLSIKRESSELSYVFDQPRLVLGSKGSPPVDLTLSDPSLLPIHLIIFRRGKDYYAENVGQDPYTRVSGVPFWKKRLKSGDKISLGHSEITFFQLASPAYPDETKGESPLSLPPPQKEVVGASSDSHSFDVERETNLIERLTPVHSESPLHLWLLFVGLVFIFTSLFGMTLAITMREKTERQKVVAARHLSDIGMLLTYAQLYELEPSRQSFLDPEFLKSIAPKVLLSEFNSIDKEGYLEGVDYLTRIYSDGDLKRFILIAQPEHHFFQWLVPAWTLVLDSDEMIIRATQDLKELNRLLAGGVGIEEINLALLTQKIREIEAIPLKEISRGRDGFVPPEELSYVDPRGTFYVYNAPRYYLFNQSLVELAKELSEGGKSHDLLKEELALRDRFPLMIFYTTLGIESAIDARKILSEDWPEVSHLIGYLEMGTEGDFEKSHLLMMGHRSTSTETANEEKIDEESSSDPLATYSQHPLFLELDGLLKERNERLKPYHEPLVALLEEHIIHSDRQFFLRHRLLFDDFKEALKREQQGLDEAVNALYEKYVVKSSEFSIPLFISMLDLAGVEVGYEVEEFLPLARPLLALRPGQEQLEALFAWVQSATSIPILDQAVALAHDLLTHESIPDHHILSSWQAQLRSLVIYKLETLFWMPHPEGEALHDHETIRWMVGRILKNGYITEADKREFYLSQIDLVPSPADQPISSSILDY